MKSTVMKSIFVFLMTGIISFPVHAAESTIFTVNGMVCAFCAQGIEKKLQKMPETAAVFVDLAEKTVIVEAKPDMTVPTDKVIQEIKDAGYDVTATKTVSQSVEDLKQVVKTQHE